MSDNQQVGDKQSPCNKEIQSQDKPTYHKPKTSLFLENLSMIQGGVDTILESQGGDGYFDS